MVKAPLKVGTIISFETTNGLMGFPLIDFGINGLSTLEYFVYHSVASVSNSAIRFFFF
jgi:hypothetical protein